MKKCPNCENDIQDESKFCTNCGKELVVENEQLEAITSNQEEQTEKGENETEEIVEEEDQQQATVDLSKEDSESPDAVNLTVEPVEEVASSENMATLEHSSDELENDLEKKPGNRKKVGIIAAAIAAVAVIGVAAMVGVKRPGTEVTAKDPKEAVVQAFKSVYTDDTVRPIEEIFGFGALSKSALTQKMEVDLGLKLEGSSDLTMNQLSGSGFDMKSKNDYQNKKFMLEMGIQYQGMDLAHANMYLDQSSIMLQVPELSKKVFSLNYADDLEGQIENSPYLGTFLTYSDLDINSVTDYLDYIMSFYGNDGKVPFDLVALWERYKTGSKAMEEFKAAMTVKQGETASYTIDGNAQECQGYDVTITKDAVLSFLRTSSEFFLEDETFKKDIFEYLTQVIRLSEGMSGYNVYGIDADDLEDEVWTEAESSIDEMLTALEDIMGDVTMSVFVDKDGRLVALNAVTELENDGEVVNAEFKAELKGGVYLTQNVDASLVLYNDEQEVEFIFTKEGTYDGKTLTCDMDFNMNSSYDKLSLTYEGSYDLESKEYNMDIGFAGTYTDGSIVIEGIVTEFEKGKTFVAAADKIEVIVDDESLVKLSGSYGIKPFKGDVEALEGDIIDIFAATKKEWEDVQAEAMVNVFSLYGKLQ